jgi:HPt (histidine-containing phosphotransfer) domain-containing protein
MAPRVPYLSFWPRAVLLSASADLCSRYSVRGNKVNVATPDVLNIKELLNRVDNDHELVSELFFIFKSAFPAHLQRLSDAVANELSTQVEAESHTLKGMLLNLSAARAAALAADLAADLESLGREGKIAGMREAFAGFQSESETLLLQMESVEFQP